MSIADQLAVIIPSILIAAFLLGCVMSWIMRPPRVYRRRR